jgi:hypothetical protein
MNLSLSLTRFPSLSFSAAEQHRFEQAAHVALLLLSLLLLATAFWNLEHAVNVVRHHPVAIPHQRLPVAHVQALPHVWREGVGLG